MNDSVSSTSKTGEADQIIFDVVYCVFEAQAGTTVSVNVGGTSIGLSENGDYDACVNGVGTNYTVSTAVKLGS